MKKPYASFLRLLKNNSGKLGLALSMIGSTLSAQITYSFTAAGATGKFGPTQTQINTAYASTNLNGAVTVNTAGVQSWTVPGTGPYRIIANGGQGGASWGLGASIAGDYTLTAGTVLNIIVGQQGGSQDAGHGSGGGGSFIIDGTTPLVVAGGGGGKGVNAIGPQSLSDGTTSTAGQTPSSGSPGGTGGGGGAAASGNNGGTATTPGDGAGGIIWASGGGGFYTDGGTYNGGSNFGGRSFVNNGIGGDAVSGPDCGNAEGGFGGGGGCGDRGAGGGGYSGGGGGEDDSDGGGGGGSFNSGINQTNSSGVNAGDGSVMIVLLCDVNLTASGSSSLTPHICSGQSVTLTTNAVSNYNWSDGNTTSNTIVVSPTITTTYTVSGTSAMSCSNAAVITVTVSNAIPVLTLTASSASICTGNSVTLTGGGALTYSWSTGATSTSSTSIIIDAPSSNTTYTLSGTNGCGTVTSAISVTVSPLPVTAATNSVLVCAGSPATLTAGGATTYTWNPGTAATNPFIVTPAANTIYTVTGQSGNCLTSATVAVNTNPLPNLSISTATTAICQGDQITLTVSGNANSYTWSPGNQNSTSITDSPAMTTAYLVEGINSFGCLNSISQLIIVSPQPVITITPSNSIVCSGGLSTLTGHGANTYSWFDGTTTASVAVNPTVTSTYSVTGTSTAGCTSTLDISIMALTPTIGVISDVTGLCIGSQANLIASGADSYTWSTNVNAPSISVSPTQNTTYTVTGSVSDANSGLSCDATNTIEVTINPSPTITATTSRTIICIGESAVLTADGAGATGTYTWTGGSGIVTTATNAVSPIANQNFSVTGADANGCKGKGTVLVQVAPCTGISTIAGNNTNLTIYPNPSNGEFTISADQNIMLQITNELGQQVKTVILNSANHEVKVTNLSNGIYFITGKNENGSVKQKIIIAK